MVQVLGKKVTIFDWELGRNSAPREGQLIPCNVAFHKGLYCLLRQKQSKEKEIQLYLQILYMYNRLSQVNCIKPKEEYIST